MGFKSALLGYKPLNYKWEILLCINLCILSFKAKIFTQVFAFVSGSIDSGQNLID